MAAFFEHPADNVSLLGERFFADRTDPKSGSPFAIAMDAAKHFRQRVTLARIYDGFYGFAVCSDNVGQIGIQRQQEVVCLAAFFEGEMCVCGRGLDRPDHGAAP